jgi:hypothetical protein
MRPVRRANNLATFVSLNLLDPSVPVKNYTWIAFLLLYYLDQKKQVCHIFYLG